MNPWPAPCRRLDRSETDRAVEVLRASFENDPAIGYFLNGPGSRFTRDIQTLVRFFIEARHLRNEPLLAVGDPLVGVAMVSRPSQPSPPEVVHIRERTWAEIGAESRARYERFGATCEPFMVDRPRWHLNMIGVHPDAQGRGHGRTLLECVHRLSAEDPDSTGVSLVTETESNVSLYRHFGYESTGRAAVTEDLHIWCMFRADP
ncbi:MAG: GNAT family N-acetyltransferase [Phycisphaeraceae bacterium]|nr:GNAT family N-acetyltransferase [Phycisphaeraceae bacterium]